MSQKKDRNRMKHYIKAISSLLTERDYRPITADQMMDVLSIALQNRKIFHEAISRLRSDQFIEVKKGLIYRFPEEKVIASGILRVHPRGFGFLQPDEKELFPVDIFIPKHEVNGAVDGDRVEVIVNTQVISEKGPEGKVYQILQRGRSHVAGTIVEVDPEIYAYVPLLGQNQRMLLKQPSQKELKLGDRIVIRVLDWGSESRGCYGEMASYIGHISDATCDVTAAIEEFELHDRFPKKVLEEVKAFGTQVSRKEILNREDLRNLECFTIDPDTAKDYDDALSLSRDKEGHYQLGVHIADVSHYVKPGTALDSEAKLRCNSVYFPGTVLPMLPHELSSHLCSLKPDVNRLAISVLMKIDDKGELLNYRITRSVIKSAKRFSYKAAKTVLDGSLKSHHQKTLFLMVDLCHRLKKSRSERGSIEFALPDTQLYMNDAGIPEKIEIVEYDITHQMVEEFMLKANEVIATHLAKQGKPLTYRIHEEPSHENMKDFAALAASFGFNLSEIPTNEELQNLFNEARERPYGQFLAQAFIRSMRLAIYSTQNIGHYGLGLEYYTHFTSPIRRYIDLIVHRVLFEEISRDENLEEIAQQCSEKERVSARAENSVTHLKKLRMLVAMQKKEPYSIYDAIITGIKPYGFSFEVIDFLFEGFLPLSEIGDDFFIYDEKMRALRGKYTFRIYSSGERIQVSLRSVNLINLEAKWSLVLKDSKPSGKKIKKKRYGKASS